MNEQFPTPLPPQGQAIDQRLNNAENILEAKRFSAAWVEAPREGNTTSEDRMFISPPNPHGETYIGVFDGVGGHEAGEVASGLAAAKLSELADKDSSAGIQNPGVHIDYLFREVSGAVINGAKERGLEHAGTTGTIAVLKEGAGKNGGSLLVGGAVGDSLGFIVRANGAVVPMFKEETGRQKMLDGGAGEAAADRFGNQITNCITPGLDDDGKPVYKGLLQTFEFEVFRGDQVVLTTDGITGDTSRQRLRDPETGQAGAYNEEVISKVVGNPNLTAKEKAQMLKDLSTKKDDKTAIVIDVHGGPFTERELAADMDELRREHGLPERQRRLGGFSLGKAEVVKSEAPVMAAPERPMTHEERVIADLNKTIDASSAGMDEIKSRLGSEDYSKLFGWGVATAYFRQLARQDEKGTLGSKGYERVGLALAAANDLEKKLPESVKKYAGNFRVHIVNKTLAQDQINEIKDKRV